MAQEENLTKRERQKQRRSAKREVQQAEQAKDRRKRVGTIVLAGVLVAGLIGAAVANVVANRRAVEQLADDVAARLADLGCTEITPMPNLGAGHINPATPETLTAQPPDALYGDRPTSSGMHLGSVVATGVYDVEIDERLTTHNQEHGYVIFHYAQAAPDAEVEALKGWAQERIDDGFPKIVVTPWGGDSLPDDANFSAVAWDARQTCDQFDPDVFQVVLDQHHSSEGDAPPAEKNIAPHLSTDQAGVLAPEGDEPLLFPPLGESGTAPIEEVPTDGETEPAETEPAETEPAETEPIETATE